MHLAFEKDKYELEQQILKRNSKMTKDDILEELTERDLLIENEHIVLVDGFEEAFFRYYSKQSSSSNIRLLDMFRFINTT